MALQLDQKHDRKDDIMALQLDQMVIFLFVCLFFYCKYAEPAVNHPVNINFVSNALYIKIVNNILELQKILVKNSKALHI